MESWIRVWREGIVPQLSVPLLESLRKALRDDDPRLLQGATTTPPPLQCVLDWPVEAACAISLPGVEEHGGWGKATVGEVEEFFARVCFEADQKSGEPGAIRYFLNWADETPRAEMIAKLLPEVELAIREKEKEFLPLEVLEL